MRRTQSNRSKKSSASPTSVVVQHQPRSVQGQSSKSYFIAIGCTALTLRTTELDEAAALPPFSSHFSPISYLRSIGSLCLCTLPHWFDHAQTLSSLRLSLTSKTSQPMMQPMHGSRKKRTFYFSKQPSSLSNNSPPILASPHSIPNADLCLPRNRNSSWMISPDSGLKLNRAGMSGCATDLPRQSNLNLPRSITQSMVRIMTMQMMRVSHHQTSSISRHQAS